MRPEAPVLERQRRARDALGRIVDRPIAIIEPAFVAAPCPRIADLRDEGAVAIVKDRRRRRRDQMRARVDIARERGREGGESERGEGRGEATAAPTPLTSR